MSNPHHQSLLRYKDLYAALSVIDARILVKRRAVVKNGSTGTPLRILITGTASVILEQGEGSELASVGFIECATAPGNHEEQQEFSYAQQSASQVLPKAAIFVNPSKSLSDDEEERKTVYKRSLKYPAIFYGHGLAVHVADWDFQVAKFMRLAATPCGNDADLEQAFNIVHHVHTRRHGNPLVLPKLRGTCTYREEEFLSVPDVRHLQSAYQDMYSKRDGSRVNLPFVLPNVW